MFDNSKQSIRYASGMPHITPQRSIIMPNGLFVRFLQDDRGEHAIEFLMILAFGVLPLITAMYFLQDILQEYVAYSQIFVSSPFF